MANKWKEAAQKHFKRRTRERFPESIKRIKRKDRLQIINKIKKNQLYKIADMPDGKRSMYELMINGQVVKVIYDKQLDELVTILISTKQRRKKWYNKAIKRKLEKMYQNT